MIVGLALILTNRPRWDEVGSLILIALLISAVTWIVMFPNWSWTERQFPHSEVTVRQSGNWMTIDLPQKTFRLPAFLIRVSHEKGRSGATIRFPISIFYFYSHFPDSRAEET